MDLRDRLPLDKVIHCTRSLLEEAGYELEIDGISHRYDPRIAITVISRAHILDDAGESFGEHLQAVVGLGERPSYPGGMLRLHFTLAGEWITEDRIAPPSQLPPAP